MKDFIIPKVINRVGVIYLNNPRKLNALNFEMIKKIREILEKWEDDNRIKAVLFDSLTDKAFCSGGDLKDLYNNFINKDSCKRKDEFFATEFELDKYIASYKKPIISHWRGIVMGGGIGLSINSDYIISEESVNWAMPETGLGFVPDVGVCNYISRLPKALGHFVGILGRSLEASDLVKYNFAHVYIDSKDYEKLIEKLIDLSEIYEGEELIEKLGPENVPLIYTTITNNTVCGQPVSMANMRECSRIAHKYEIPYMFDAARWAENAYFIKVNEEGYADKSIPEIAKEMFSYCDGFTASLKKDGHANMGGVLAFRDKGLFWKKFSDFNEDGSVKTDVGILLKVKQISSYGNDSYGGMSGRDIMALAAGLYEAAKFDYLDARVKQCEYLAQGFYKAGVKGVVLPAGGHGVYINMDEFFDNKRGPETFAGQGFSVELIRRYGIRTAELGNYSMEYDLKTPEQQAEVANVVRFAVNRSQLSKEHMDYVIAAVKALYEDRATIPNIRIVKGKNLPMRHFHAFLETYEPSEDEK